MNPSRRAIACCLLIATVASGCQYLQMVRQRRSLRSEFASDPRLALKRTLAPEDSFRLTGRLAGAERYDGALLVVAVGHRFKTNEVVAWRAVFRSLDLYDILLPKGDFDLLVLADHDGDNVFESDGLVGQTDLAAPTHVDRQSTRDGFTVEGPTIRVDARRPTVAGVPISISVTRTHNVLPSLSDDFFSRQWGQRGLFHPTELLVHTQGQFFGLEEPDPQKTQIVFVHGAGGVPAEFATLVDGLDRKRFQPWFYFYPSGLPLSQSAATMADVLEVVVRDLHLQRVVIVAHSMGGLVSDAALATLSRNGLPDWLALFVTIATPYDGHPAARLGVERAPEVVPSWRDMVPGSPFLRDVHATALPAGLPFILLFAYDNGGSRVRVTPSGDGTVPLSSQLAVPVMLRARQSFGIDANHTAVLTDPTTVMILQRLLEQYAVPRRTRFPRFLGGP